MLPSTTAATGHASPPRAVPYVRLDALKLPLNASIAGRLVASPSTRRLRARPCIAAAKFRRRPCLPELAENLFVTAVSTRSFPS